MSSRPSGLVLAGLAAVAALTLSALPAAPVPGPPVRARLSTSATRRLATSDVDDLSVAYCDGSRGAAEVRRCGVPDELRPRVRRPQPDRPRRRRAARRRVRHRRCPPSYDQALRDLEAQLAGFPEDRIDEVMEVESVTAYVQAVETRSAAAAGRGGHDGRRRRHQAGARCGRAAAVDLRAPRRHQPEVRHRGQHPHLDAPTFVDTSTSHALSANAVAAAQAEPDQELAATLPSSQRCG